MMFGDHENFTVESVTAGHPDKVCDQIADALLDACLAQDPASRVAIEALGTANKLILGGEVTTKAEVDFVAVAKSVYAQIGYQADDLQVQVLIQEQSPDIALGVDKGGAGDQGIMYGYASNATKALMPLGVPQVHALARQIERVRQSGQLPWLGPDGKAQLTYREGEIDTVLVSAQHSSDRPIEEVRAAIRTQVIEPTLGLLGQDVKIIINPTGLFTRGGFAGDSGLTGRKIIIDTYCGLAPHGGGSFSGKDATKVDRSAAYLARLAAKSLVAQGLAKECLVSVAYAIGLEKPLMLLATDEAGADLTAALTKQFDFRPLAIIERLGLRAPIFQKTAAYGHFGRTDFKWEQV